MARDGLEPSKPEGNWFTASRNCRYPNAPKYVVQASTLAKKFGVSDAAIAKQCKKLGIKKPPRGYWNDK